MPVFPPSGAYFLSVGDTVFSPPTTAARLTIQFISLPTFLICSSAFVFLLIFEIVLLFKYVYFQIISSRKKDCQLTAFFVMI